MASLFDFALSGALGPPPEHDRRPVLSLVPPTAIDAVAPCQEAARLYNEAAERAGLPLLRLLTPSRLQKLKARLRECGGVEGWRKALESLEAWRWGRGDNPSGWRASFDFMLQPSSFAKLYEGAYPDDRTATRPADASATSRALAALARGARPATDD